MSNMNKQHKIFIICKKGDKNVSDTSTGRARQRIRETANRLRDNVYNCLSSIDENGK